MALELLGFDELGDPHDIANRKWRRRYEDFGSEVIARILDSGKPIHYTLTNISSLRAVLGKSYEVRLLNNKRRLLESMEILYDRVRLEDIRVTVIDAVNGLIEVSEKK